MPEAHEKGTEVRSLQRESPCWCDKEKEWSEQEEAWEVRREGSGGWQLWTLRGGWEGY